MAKLSLSYFCVVVCCNLLGSLSEIRLKLSKSILCIEKGYGRVAVQLSSVYGLFSSFLQRSA